MASSNDKEYFEITVEKKPMCEKWSSKVEQAFVVDKVAKNNLMTVTGSMFGGRSCDYVDSNDDAILYPQFKIVFEKKDYEEAKRLIQEQVKQAVKEEISKVEDSIFNIDEYEITPQLPTDMDEFRKLTIDEWEKLVKKTRDEYQCSEAYYWDEDDLIKVIELFVEDMKKREAKGNRK